jgi:hypothetical protein
VSDTDVNVRITAQVDSLQSGASAAQDSFRGIRMSAEEARAALIAAGGSWDQLAKSQYQAEQAAKAAATAQVSAGEAATGAAAATTGVRVATAGAIQEYVRLGHEIMQGNFSRIPGTIVVTASRMGGLQTIVQALSGVWGLAAAGAVAFGGALAYITIEALKAASAMREVDAAVAFKNLSVSGAEIESYVTQVERMGGSSYETAAEVVRAFVDMKNASAPLIQALIDQIKLYADATGEKLPEAAKKLAAMFGDLQKNGEKTLQTLGASRAEIEAFDEALKRGDVVAEYTIALTALNEATTRVQQATHGATAEEEHAVEELMALTGGEQTATEGANQLSAALNKISSAQIAKSAQDIAGAANGAGAAAGPTGIPLDQMRENMAQMEAVNQDTQAALLQQEIAGWKDRIAVGDLYGKELTEAQGELAKLEVALSKETGSEAIAATRDKVAEIAAAENTGKVQQLTAARDQWAQLLAGDKLTAAQRVEVEREYHQTVAELNRTAASERQAVEKSDVDTDIAIGRLALEQKKSQIQEAINARQGGTAQEYDALKALAAEEEKLDEQELQSQLSHLQRGTAAYEEAYNQIRILRAKLSADLQNYDKDEAQASARAAQQDTQAWRDTLVKDIFTKRQSLTQSLIAMSSQLVQKEIEDDLKYYTTKLLYLALGLTAEKGAAQGGLLVHAIAELSKTQATQTGVTARTAYEQAGNSSFLSLIAQKVIRWVTGETTETAATQTGEAAKSAYQLAADLAGRASSISAGFSQISIDAAVAAAGAFAATAPIPFVGPELAPEAAAAAYAATMGWAAGLGGGVSAEGGLENVGSSPLLGFLHPQEAVMPASVAQPMRQFFSGGGSQQGGGDSYGITIQAIDTLTGAQFLKNNAGVIIASLALAKRNGNSAFSPGG